MLSGDPSQVYHGRAVELFRQGHQQEVRRQSLHRPFTKGQWVRN